MKFSEVETSQAVSHSFIDSFNKLANWMRWHMACNPSTPETEAEDPKSQASPDYNSKTLFQTSHHTNPTNKQKLSEDRPKALRLPRCPSPRDGVGWS